MESGNLDGSSIHPSLHSRYIANVYPKYCDYNGWNFPRQTFGFNTGKLLLFTFNGMLNVGLNFVIQLVLYLGTVVFWCLVIGLPSNLPVRHDNWNDGISGS